jgi:hypothetical protein
MEIITQIVEVLSRYKLQEIDVLDNSDSSSRYTELYRLIKEGKIKTDADAEKHFYGEVKKNNSSYRAFKSQFLDRLLNTLYFIDTDNPNFNDFQKTYYAVLHEWGTINLLYRRSAFYAANHLAERLLQVCIKYEFTDICVMILEKLKSDNAVIFGDKKKYKEYKEKFWHYKEVRNAEHIAQEAFENIRIEYVKSTEYRPEMSTKAIENLEYLENLRKEQDSFIFLVHYFAIKEAIFSTQNDWDSVIKVCDEALFFFNKKPFKVVPYIATFINQKVIALLMLNQYEDCEKSLNDVLNLYDEGISNWYKIMEIKILLHFHTQNYIEVYKTYNYAVSLKEFKNQIGHDSEIWKLFEAYLYFVISLNKIPNLDKNALQSFKLSKFLNQIPIFTNDKKGMNIPVLIIQICLILIEKKYNKLIDYTEALEKYMMRNVPKDNANYRANQFMKILIEVSKSNFNKIALKRQLAKKIEDLSTVPSTVAQNGYKIEIIPFEIIWEELLNSFEKK